MCAISLLSLSTPPHKNCFISDQVFVRFSVGDKEIIYVTKYSTDTADYSFELDVNEAASDFGSLSDSYSMVSRTRPLPSAHTCTGWLGMWYIQCCRRGCGQTMLYCGLVVFAGPIPSFHKCTLFIENIWEGGGRLGRLGHFCST